MPASREIERHPATYQELAAEIEKLFSRPGEGSQLRKAAQAIVEWPYGEDEEIPIELIIALKMALEQPQPC